MGGKKQQLVGQTFARLTVKSHAGCDKHGKTLWKCECSCGVKDVLVNGSVLVRGLVKSCGCFHKEQASRANRTHGRTRTPEYRTWQAMLRRCYNKNCIDFDNYGARGICVCSRWRNSFENFFKDMGIRPDGTTLDRKQVNKGYSPKNCRWATKEQQNNNTRASRYVTVKGRRQTISQWAREVGISTATVYRRLQLGWSMLKAVSTRSMRKGGGN
jgi:hypothetical protein